MKKIALFLILFALISCSLKPERTVTRDDLERHRIYSRFVIKESPEQVLEALNTYGEVILRSKRNIKHRDIPVHVKILATSSGLEILDYER